MIRLRRYRAPSILIAAFAAILVFAATAAAETRIGESSSPIASGSRVDPESQIVKATGSYDTSTGATSFAITTQAPPQAKIEGDYNPSTIEIELFTAPSGCTIAALESSPVAAPVVGIDAKYGDGVGFALYVENESVDPGSESLLLGPTEKVVDGATTTLSIASARIANQGFNCATVGVLAIPTEKEKEEEKKEKEEEKTGRVFGSASFVIVALNALPTPPAPVVNNPPPPPAPPAAALSIAKAKKPLKLKVGKWKTVKVNVANTGGTATAPGLLQLKATKGVIVKGGKQKLPVLVPGGTWTVSYEVKLTAKAKKTSTLSLAGTAGTVTSKSSLVLKLAGG